MVEALARMERRGDHDRPRHPLAALGRIRAGHGAARGRRFTNSPARASISARRSNWAIFSSARWACPAPRKPRPAPGRPPPSVLEDLAEQGNELRRAAFSTGASFPSSNRPTPTPCPASSIRTRGACTPPMRSPRRRRDGSRHRSPICKIFRCATKRAAKSAAPSSRAEGHKLISADYSQIELRLLAHIADIPQLKKAFAEGLDIHAMTASEMFGVPIEGMPAGGAPPRQGDQFRHHLWHFGLRPRQSARHSARGGGRLYQALFRALSRHSRLYGRRPERLVREKAYVTTIFGRKCHFPRIDSRQIRRSAPFTNAPRSMRRSRARPPTSSAAPWCAWTRRSPSAGLSAQMLLQVHDELVFEAPDAEVEATIEVVRRIMEQAPRRRCALRAAAGRRARRRKLGRGALSAIRRTTRSQRRAIQCY